MILKLMRYKITAVNDTIDICQPHSSNNKNYFIRYWIPFALKAIEPPFKCPVKAGIHNWKHPGHANLDKYPAPSIMKKMNMTNVNVTIVFFTMINNVRVDLISAVEINKVTLVV